MLITALVMVVVMAPLANLSSKWGFQFVSYPVPPSEITEDTELTQFDDNIAQIAFKHTMTLAWCFLMYMMDSRILYKRGKKPIFVDKETIENHRAMKKKDRHKLLWLSCLPSLCDVAFSVFQSSATRMIRSSTVQMIANVNILITTLLNMIFRRRGITFGQILGIFVVLIGVVLSGLDGVLYPDVNSSETGSEGLAIGFVFIAAFSRSFCTVIEQWLVADKPVPTLKFYAIEQVFSCFYIMMIMLVKYWIGRNDVYESWWEMWNNPDIFGVQILYGAAACGLNSFGIILGRLSSPIFRMLAMSTRTITSWIVELLLGWNTFEWISLCGQLVLLLGLVLYIGVLYPLTNRYIRRPVTCKGRLKPPPDAILSDKQRNYPRMQQKWLNPDGDTMTVSVATNETYMSFDRLRSSISVSSAETIFSNSMYTA